jgi:hypothetical protein
MSVAADWSVLLLRIRKIIGSNLGPETEILTEQFCVSVSPSSQMQAYYLKLGNGCFLPHPLQFMVRPNAAPPLHESSYITEQVGSNNKAWDFHSEEQFTVSSGIPAVLTKLRCSLIRN